MEKLPKMYHNRIDKDIRNNEKIYNSMNDISCEYDIQKKIKDIFDSPEYIYKINVTIVTNNDIINKKIIGKNNNNLITIDNEHIPIDSIVDIYKNN